jgi:hypothetical protein
MLRFCLCYCAFGWLFFSFHLKLPPCWPWWKSGITAFERVLLTAPLSGHLYGLLTWPFGHSLAKVSWDFVLVSVLSVFPFFHFTWSFDLAGLYCLAGFAASERVPLTAPLSGHLYGLLTLPCGHSLVKVCWDSIFCFLFLVFSCVHFASSFDLAGLYCLAGFAASERVPLTAPLSGHLYGLLTLPFGHSLAKVCWDSIFVFLFSVFSCVHFASSFDLAGLYCLAGFAASERVPLTAPLSGHLYGLLTLSFGHFLAKVCWDSVLFFVLSVFFFISLEVLTLLAFNALLELLSMRGCR